MVPRASRPSARPSGASPDAAPETPRAKRLVGRDPRPSASTWRALERYESAVDAFSTACDERASLGRIDDRYADLAHEAAALIDALLDDRRANRPEWTSDALRARVLEYAQGTRNSGHSPEDDVQLADLALREARGIDPGSRARASS